MKNKIVLLGILLVSTYCSCSKSDDVIIAAPELSYVQEIKATFFEEGSTTPPSVNWNGDVGSFGLQNSTEGITIDQQTGIIDWGRSLPLGTNSIKVVAFNNAGTMTSTVQLENIFVGKFKGSYVHGGFSPVGSTFAAEFNFKANGLLDGAIIFTDGDGVTSEPTLIEGTWTIVGNELSAEYLLKLEILQTPKFIKATVAHSETGAYIKGRFGRDIDNEGLYSEFLFDLEANP